MRKLSPRRGESEISMEIIDQMVEKAETTGETKEFSKSQFGSTDSKNSLKGFALSQSNDELKYKSAVRPRNAQILKKKTRPKYAETIFGCGGIKTKKSLTRPINHIHSGSEIGNKRGYSKLDSECIDRSALSRPHAESIPEGMEQGSIAQFDEAALVFDFSPYADLINYRDGLMARVVSQSISYMASMEIGRQAGCACDQTLLAFGDEIARKIENSWEQAALGLSDAETPKSHDIVVVLEEYGQARVRLIQKGVQFELCVHDVRIWDSYRHQISGWPLTLNPVAK